MKINRIVAVAACFVLVVCSESVRLETGADYMGQAGGETFDLHTLQGLKEFERNVRSRGHEFGEEVRKELNLLAEATSTKPTESKLRVASFFYSDEEILAAAFDVNIAKIAQDVNLNAVAVHSFIPTARVASVGLTQDCVSNGMQVLITGIQAFFKLFHVPGEAAFAAAIAIRSSVGELIVEGLTDMLGETLTENVGYSIFTEFATKVLFNKIGAVSLLQALADSMAVADYFKMLAKITAYILVPHANMLLLVDQCAAVYDFLHAAYDTCTVCSHACGPNPSKKCCFCTADQITCLVDSDRSVFFGSPSCGDACTAIGKKAVEVEGDQKKKVYGTCAYNKATKDNMANLPVCDMPQENRKCCLCEKSDGPDCLADGERRGWVWWDTSKKCAKVCSEKGGTSKLDINGDQKQSGDCNYVKTKSKISHWKDLEMCS